MDRVTMKTGDGVTGPEAPKAEGTDIPVMPQGGDEKFYNKEDGKYDWESAYKEADFNAKGRKEGLKIDDGDPPKETPAVPKTETPAPKADPKTDPKVDPRETMGEDYNRFSDEYAETGQLSEDSYKQLMDKHGHDKTTVDTYIRGMRGQMQDIRDAGLEAAEGEEGFQAMASWAKENLTTREAQLYNIEAESGDIDRVTTAVRALYAKYSTAEGFVPDYVNGGDGAGGDKDVYESWNEVQRDMASGGLYAENDPVEQKRVRAKLDRSNL